MAVLGGAAVSYERGTPGGRREGEPLQSKKGPLVNRSGVCLDFFRMRDEGFGALKGSHPDEYL